VSAPDPAPEQPMEVGVFESYRAAENAVAALAASGFPREAISVICPTCSADQFPRAERVDPAGSHTKSAAAAGGVIGSLLGGLTAVIGVAATGGMGLLAAGPLLGATATGGVAGAFVGAMLTRGFEPEIADFYDQALSKGQILVAVDTRLGPGRPAAEQALVRAGAMPFALREG
jgi:hypothetical protein